MVSTCWQKVESKTFVFVSGMANGLAFDFEDVGENIAWDLTENGHPCRESVYRWYAELFYFNPKKPTKGNTLPLIQSEKLI